MRKQGSGALVNNSSFGRLVGVAGPAVYHASKHGVQGLTKRASLEYASRASASQSAQELSKRQWSPACSPSEAEAMKEMMRDVPIGRLGRPEEIAAAVLWLCGPGASFVIGHALVVDGGYTVR